MLDALAHLPAMTCRFAAGENLFHQSDEVRVVHRVESGTVHLVRHCLDGGALVLQRAGAGAIVAEASLFSDRYHCGAVALAPTATRAFDKTTLRACLGRDPALAEAWAAHLAHEVQAARLRAEILSLRTVAERLDGWLAVNGGTWPPKGTWHTIAAELAVSPEALYRELAKRR